MASQIADADAHPGLLHAVFTQGHSAVQGLFRERPIVLVSKKKARRRVTGNVDIWPAVVVKIGGNHRETVTGACLLDSSRAAPAAKCAIAVLPIHPVAATHH